MSGNEKVLQSSSPQVRCRAYVPLNAIACFQLEWDARESVIRVTEKQAKPTAFKGGM